MYLFETFVLIQKVGLLVKNLISLNKAMGAFLHTVPGYCNYNRFSDNKKTYIMIQRLLKIHNTQPI